MGKRRPWWKLKRVWLLCGLVGAYLLLGFLFVPWLAQRQIVGFAQQQLQLDGTIVDTDFNPLTFRFSMEDARFQDSGREVLALDSLVINFDPSVSLFTWSWAFEAVELQSPYVYLHADETGRLNWQKIVDRMPASEEPAPERDAGLPRLQLGRLAIADGVIDYVEARGDGEYRQELSPIDFTLGRFSTLPDSDGPYSLTAVTESGATVRWTGRLEVLPTRIQGTAALQDLQLAELDRYLGPALPVRLAGGSLTLETQYRFELSPQPQLLLSDGSIAISEPVLRDPAAEPDEPLLSAQRLTVGGLTANLLAQPPVFETRQLAAQALQVRAVLEADGRLNWERLLFTDDESGPDFLFETAQLTITGGRVDWIDRVREPAVEMAIGDLAVNAESLSIPASGVVPFSLGAQLGGGDTGQVKLDGTWFVDDERLEADATMTAVPLAVGNDYLAGLARAHWSSGELDFKGRIETAVEEPTVSLEATAAIGNAELRDDNDVPVLAWEKLAIGAIEFQSPEPLVALRDLTLQAPFLRLHIAEGYETNIGRLLIEPESAAAPDEAAAAPSDVPADFLVGPIELRAARIDFEDENVPGGFSAAIHDLGGTIGRLDSTSRDAAQIDLNGKANEQASLSVIGEIEPFGADLMADITADFQNLSLVRLSPYAAKFAGYRIDQGKLRLEMRYELRDQQLSGNNHAVLDQLKLGEKVESESAISAPIELAIALLKDDQGVIDLNIPVSGDLANPEFSLSSVIGKAIGSAIGGIVSAPFRLLAALVGGEEEELQQVGFDPGDDALDAAAVRNMEQLASALQQRPQLRLEIRPGWVPADRNALARKALAERIRSAGGDPENLPASRPVIEQLFVADFSEAERLTVAAEHTHSAPEDTQPPAEAQQAGMLDQDAYLDALHQRLLDATEITDARLAALARSRAANVQQKMESAGIDPQRLFILDAKPLEEETTDRVELPLAVRG